MEHYDNLAAFTVVVREGSFTRAAAQLGVSQSALSHTISTLEKRLGLKLLNRTTRSISPTEAGERLYQTAVPRFADIDAQLQQLRSSSENPVGTVRITANLHAARTVLLPGLLPLIAAHPGIAIEIDSENRFIDITADRFDIGVRMGDDIAKDMIAVRIAPDTRMRVVASPAYLARAGQPDSPQALRQFSCITLRLPTHGGLLGWAFIQDGRAITMNVAGQVILNDDQMILQTALAGHGLAWLPADMTQGEIDAGRLVPLLDEWAITYPGYHLYYASRNTSHAVSLVVNTLRYRA